MKLRARKDRTRYWRIFCLIWLVTFAVLLLWQLAFWPGSFDPDTATQYAQAIGRDQFTDWHPAINTFLFYWLPYKMTGDFAAIVLFQNILFSLATAYLIATLYRRGIPVVAAVVAYLMIVLNPNIGAAMINPWKDCAMMAFAIAFVSQAFSIYRTKGKWLKKKKNVIALTIVALFICLVRHNSILFMFPAYVTLIVYAWDRRKVLAFSFTTMIVLMLVIRGPIYSMANVVPAWNRQVETLGIPMTILSDIYVQDRDCMSPEARGFMSTIASEEVWRTRYSLGNFDSIKWPEIGLLRGDNNPIEREGAAKILKYTYEVARAHPGLVLKSLFTITSQVWAIDGSDGNRIELRFEIADESLGVTAHDQNESLKKFLNTINASYSKYAIKYLFNYIGVVLLVLFTVAVARIGKIGIGRALAVVPIMCYCLASMLLVTGPAFRIFLFVFPIFMPTLYVLMFKDKKLSAKKDLQRRAMVK